MGIISAKAWLENLGFVATPGLLNFRSCSELDIYRYPCPLQGDKWPHIFISWVSTERGSSEVRIRQGKEPFYCISQVLNHRWRNLYRKRFINGCIVAKLVLQQAKLGCQDSCSNIIHEGQTNRTFVRVALLSTWQVPPLFDSLPPSLMKRCLLGVHRAPCGHFWVSHRSIRDSKMDLEWWWAYSITAVATHTCSLLISPKINQSPCFEERDVYVAALICPLKE